MPTYEVEVNGQKFDIDAPDDNAVQMAVRQLQGQKNSSEGTGPNLDEYYSSGIYSGAYNPLGPIAKTVDAFATNAQAAPLFGWGDEAVGGLSVLGGGDYQNNTNAVRSREEQLSNSNPIASTAGTIAGSALTAGGLSQAGVLPSGMLPQGASLLSRVGVGAGEGFGLGALQGAGTGEGDGSVENALYNGAIGAVAGGALPAVAQGVSSGYRSIADMLARNNAANAAGTTPEVASSLARILAADGSLGPQGLNNMQAAGREAMLADAGPNARQVLDRNIQRGGQGGVLARDRIDARVGRDAQALTDVLDTTLGSPQGLTSAGSSIRQGTAAARGNTYDAAYAAPINYADPRGAAIEDMVKNRVPRSAIAKANELMRVEGLKSQQIKANFADDGTVTFETLPDVRQLDYITRGLNDVASEADGAGAMGGTTAVGRAYGDLSKELRGNLRELVPEYGTALDTASDAISQSKALKLGANILSPSSTMDDIAIATQGMSASERTALKQGIRSNIENRVANVTRTVKDGDTDAREAIKAIKDLSSRANREKVASAIGADDAKTLFDEVDRVSKSFDLRASVADNSATYARQAADKMLTDINAPGPLGKLQRGEPLKAGKSVAQILTNTTPEADLLREDALSAQIVDLLTRPSQQAIPAFQAMQNYQGQTIANQARANRIAELLLSARSGVYPSAPLLRGDSKR